MELGSCRWKGIQDQEEGQRGLSYYKRVNLVTLNIIKSSFQQMSDNEEFEKGDAGSSDSVPTQVGSIKKGGYCMLKGFPCKVTEYSTAKPGKHGSAKATIVGLDIFTNKKVEDTAPTGATAYVPNVTKKEYEVADISEDGFVSVILEDGSLKEDLKLPDGDEEVRNTLQGLWDNKGDSQVYFTIISACGQEKYISGRMKE